MATGDVISVTIRPDGWSADVVFEGLAAGGVYANGFGANNNPATGAPKFVISLTSPGFDQSGNATTRPRTIYGTKCVRKTTPDNGQLDEAFSGGQLTARIALSEGVFTGDTAITATFLGGFLTSGGTPNNARSSFAVTSNSTLPYPKVVGRWEWPGFERQTADFPVEVWCFQPYGRLGIPVACVTFDATDESANSAATQTVTSMVISDRGGDALPVPIYRATIPVANLTQGQVVTVNFRAYPWIGDAAACLDSRTTADGVAAPSANLTPLMAYLDKANTKAVYVSVDGVGASGACSSTKAGARVTPYATIAAALTALKAFNSANNGDNSLNNCVVLLQNGTYTGTGTFTGANTKSWCEIVADTENGATEAGVIISTATNQSFNGYLKYRDVTFSGSGSGLIRGSSATTAQLWLDSATISATSASWLYQWGGGVHGTRNTVTSTANLSHYATNPSPWATVRGNACANNAQTHAYNVIGNINVQPMFMETGNTPGQVTSDNIVVAHNKSLAQGVVFLQSWASSTSITKGAAIVGNLAERINSETQPLIQIAADGTTAPLVQNIYMAHNSGIAARSNLCYQDVGTTTLTRRNWFSQFNAFQEQNVKSDTFGTPNAARIGNWAWLYGVNVIGDRTSEINFPREFPGLNTVEGAGSLGYTLDKSFNTAGTGNGDYRPAESSVLKDVATFIIDPFDIDGNARTAPDAAGAYRQTPAVVISSGTPRWLLRRLGLLR